MESLHGGFSYRLFSFSAASELMSPYRGQCNGAAFLWSFVRGGVSPSGKAYVLSGLSVGHYSGDSHTCGYSRAIPFQESTGSG